MAPRARNRLARCGATNTARFVRVGVEVPAGREALARNGFHVCEPDLEHELVRALGLDGAERVLAANRDLDRFRTMQQQPAQWGRDPVALLCRWVGAGSGRKLRYAGAFAAALGPADVPPPLAALLEDVTGTAGRSPAGAP